MGAAIGCLALLASCSGSDGDDATTTVAETSAAPTTAISSVEAFVLPETPLSGVLDQEYPAGGLFDAGSVTASWFRSDENYVVVYSGLDLEGIGAACPGNSIQLADGSFSSVSNAPSGPGGCEGATTPEPPVPPQVCGDLIVYTTAIAATEQGLLYGTFERSSDEGFVGATSVVPTTGDPAPEIQTGAEAYELDGTVHAC